MDLSRMAARVAADKPGVIVLSDDGDTEGFKWLSDGWNAKDTPRSRALMKKARECIAQGEDVPEVCRLLEAAGFRVERSS